MLPQHRETVVALQKEEKATTIKASDVNEDPLFVLYKYRPLPLYKLKNVM